MATNPWDLIFIDDFESAYKIADQNYCQAYQNFDLRARAISSFLLGNYEKALTDFLLLKDIEHESNRVSDGTFLEIGLCYYTMGELEQALEHFKYPVENSKLMKYTSDICVPGSILFFLAIKLNRSDLYKIATKELKKRKVIIPMFLLDQASEQDLNKYWEEQINETLRNRMECKVEFYKAVKALQNGYFEKYQQHINHCVHLKGNYLEFEYYMAKIEQRRVSEVIS
jgi:tetratricopeptide (TPR) repeat protein